MYSINIRYNSHEITGFIPEARSILSSCLLCRWLWLEPWLPNPWLEPWPPDPWLRLDPWLWPWLEPWAWPDPWLDPPWLGGTWQLVEGTWTFLDDPPLTEKDEDKLFMFNGSNMTRGSALWLMDRLLLPSTSPWLLNERPWGVFDDFARSNKLTARSSKEGDRDSSVK